MMDDFESHMADDPYAQTMIMLERRRINDTVTLLGLIYRLTSKHNMEMPSSILEIVESIAGSMSDPENNLILNTAKMWVQRQGPSFSVIEGGKVAD